MINVKSDTEIKQVADWIQNPNWIQNEREFVIPFNMHLVNLITI